MPPLPSDVREALGLADDEIPWVRLRSSLGSIVGETFVVGAGASTRVAMRTSALADLEELSLASPPRYEESPNDAAVVVSPAGIEERIAVGYLERDAVRAFFEAPSPDAHPVEPLSPASITNTSLAPDPGSPPALDGARADLLTTLRARPRFVTLDGARGALVDLLAVRLATRRADLSTKREALARAATAPRTLAEAAVAEITARTPRLDDRIGRLRKKRVTFPDDEARAVFDAAIERARADLAHAPRSSERRLAREGASREDRARRLGSSWGPWVIVLGIATVLVWQLTRC